MKESDMENSSFDINSRLNFDERRSSLNSHEERMDSMLENNHLIVKKIKQMGKEINSNLQNQNDIINDLGIKLSSTDLTLKKNNSKINDILGGTSICFLVVLTIVQVMIIIFLIFF